MISNNLTSVFFSMSYKRFQNAGPVNIFYKVYEQEYKFIILIDNHGLGRIKTVKNLSDIKKKILLYPGLMQNSKCHFLTVLLHTSSKDRFSAYREKNLINISCKGDDKYSSYENCFSSEIQNIKSCRKKDKLMRKQVTINDRNIAHHIPFFTIMMIIMCVLVFLNYKNIQANNYGISGMSILKKKYFTLISYVFLHGNIFHLINNCVALGVAGSVLEKRIGNLKYGFLLFLSAIYGGIATVLMKMFTQNMNLPTVGMSGVVYAVCGALMIYQIINKQRYASVIFYTLVSLCLGFFNPNTDNYVHIAGLLIGILYMVILSILHKTYKNMVDLKLACMKMNDKKSPIFSNKGII